uniref:hypothetical protein n=1 Tax=Flavobacterium sp. TaxID=239 RepID=UPI00404ADD46
MGKYILIALISVLLLSCSALYRVEEKSNRLISELLVECDTIYALKSSEFKRTYIWYYNNDTLNQYRISPGKVEKITSYKTKEMKITNDTLMKYFKMEFEENEINCFHHAGHHSLEYDIFIFIEDKEPLISGINLKCLFSEKFNINSFQYKLQKELYLVFKPKNFDFENMKPY